MDNTTLEAVIGNFENKVRILEEVRELNQNLIENLSSESEFDEESYNEVMESKSDLIEAINDLNDESDKLFNQLSKEMEEDGGREKSENNKFFAIVSKLNLLSTETEREENEIKTLIEKLFSRERERIKAAHQNSGAAINYYQTMSSSKNVESMFYDSKN